MKKIVAVIAVLAMFAVACGGSDGGTSLAAGGDPDRPQSFDDLDFSSPLSEFLGFDFGASEDMEAEFAEMEREAARLTTECMLEKGFEYTPPNTGDLISFGSDGGLDYFSDEWVDKYGFGVTTQAFPQSSVGDLVGYDDEQFNDGAAFEDPNETYIQSLSDGEREAYQEALWGQPTDIGDGDGDEGFAFPTDGCQNEAFSQVFNEGPGGGMAFFEAFGDELEAMEERAESDPRVIEYRTEVSECATAAGMDWSPDTTERDVRQRFESRLDAIRPNGGGFGENPFEDAEFDPEEMTDRELDEMFRDLNRVDEADLPVLAELQAEELALARVVVDCGGGPLNEAYFLGDVRRDLEQQFLDANASELEQYKGSEG